MLSKPIARCLLVELICFAAVISNAALASPQRIDAQDASGYVVLRPISSGNLAIFPIVTARPPANTAQFLTLDEGLRDGEVLVTEIDSPGGIRRDRPGIWVPHYPDGGAQVNQLALVNKSPRPLLLLAGEIVTGGKQDRVIERDRIVPPHSDPIDLGVFCVEPHRWEQRTSHFGVLPAAIAPPAIRAQAITKKSQQAVWDQVSGFRNSFMESAPEAARTIASSSSYAAAIQSLPVQQKIDEMADPLTQSLDHSLRESHTGAVGVGVAISGELIWVDAFASPELFKKYWPKLVRSYAAEAMASSKSIRPAIYKTPSIEEARKFLSDLSSLSENSQAAAGVYRNTEIVGKDFQAAFLISLLPGMRYQVHFAKMRN